MRPGRSAPRRRPSDRAFWRSPGAQTCRSAAFARRPMRRSSTPSTRWGSSTPTPSRRPDATSSSRRSGGQATPPSGLAPPSPQASPGFPSFRRSSGSRSTAGPSARCRPARRTSASSGDGPAGSSCAPTAFQAGGRSPRGGPSTTRSRWRAGSRRTAGARPAGWRGCSPRLRRPRSPCRWSRPSRRRRRRRPDPRRSARSSGRPSARRRRATLRRRWRRAARRICASRPGDW